jgi:hypothetical protein
VRLISPQIDPQTKLGEVRILLPVRSDIRAGGFARAVFTDASAMALGRAETADPLRRRRRQRDDRGADKRVKRVLVADRPARRRLVQLVRARRPARGRAERRGLPARQRPDPAGRGRAPPAAPPASVGQRMSHRTTRRRSQISAWAIRNPIPVVVLFIGL